MGSNNSTKNNTNINLKVTKSFWNFYMLLLFRAPFYFSIYFKEKWQSKNLVLFSIHWEKRDCRTTRIFTWGFGIFFISIRVSVCYVLGKFVATNERMKTTRMSLEEIRSEVKMGRRWEENKNEEWESKTDIFHPRTEK